MPRKLVPGDRTWWNGLGVTSAGTGGWWNKKLPVEGKCEPVRNPGDTPWTGLDGEVKEFCPGNLGAEFWLEDPGEKLWNVEETPPFL